MSAVTPNAIHDDGNTLLHTALFAQVSPDQAEELLLPDPDPLPEEQAILNEQRRSVIQAMNELEVE